MDQSFLEPFLKEVDGERGEEWMGEGTGDSDQERSRFHEYSHSSKRSLLSKNININRNVIGLHFWLTI